jgi:NADPH:quinone reductase-like Zn-dependent oxidoreductase
MALKFKVGVELRVTEAINKILDGVHLAHFAVGKVCVVTSGRDGEHKEGSKHGQDMALDFRTFHLQLNELDTIVQAAKNTLGKDFDVIVEHDPDHLHVEYDPKLHLAT